MVIKKLQATELTSCRKMAGYEIIDLYRMKGLNVHVLKFEVPLDHFLPKNSSATIEVVARLVTKHIKSKVPSSKPDKMLPFDQDSNICLFLQGGPGFPCPAPEYSGITKVMIDKGFQMLYLDQRGTGLSSVIDSGKLLEFETDQLKLEYIKHFRALDIVNDAEHIRKILIGDDKWTLLGQSYGGFCSVTYLSYYPGSLNQLLLTGGIPPIGKGPDDVYTATYKRTEERNVAYYTKYPGDISKVHLICEYLVENEVVLPTGGKLSVERLQAMGILFGATSGTDSLHQLIFKLHYDLTHYSRFTFGTLTSVEALLSFDTNIIYFLFQEAIYLDSGMSSSWSADRLRSENKINFDYKSLAEKIKIAESNNSLLSNAVYFTGEMIYKSMLDDFVELQPLKGLAHLLHENTQWGPFPLYKPAILLHNEVPVAAASYVHDQYVDFELTMEAKQNIRGVEQYITTEFFHNGLRDDPEKVISKLLRLLEDGALI